MLLGSFALIAGAVLPAVLALDIKAPLRIAGGGNQKRDDSDDGLIHCKVWQDCDFPGTVNQYKPGTCVLPLSNDPDYWGSDTVIRNSYGACGADGLCTCETEKLGYQDLLRFCLDLVHQVMPSYNVIDACRDESMNEIHCTSVPPDQTSEENAPQYGPHGDIIISEGRFCYNGVYHASGEE